MEGRRGAKPIQHGLGKYIRPKTVYVPSWGAFVATFATCQATPIRLRDPGLE